MAASARSFVLNRYPRARLVNDIRRFYRNLLGQPGYIQPLRPQKDILPHVKGA